MKKMLAVVGTAVYLASPIDLIPDVVPVLGWLDDLGVMALLTRYLTRSPDEPKPLGA
ncbi:: DUF1232 [Gemmata massiliana]|uniref:: DUF1232 n=1 Tax=Gemmata massiliana TaxID=1210884 RepID=A0A6P2DEN5_9BACT|nr:YkvA family protein [Gemmata massiliana]VTS00393.1 : DUF1232 [Gemmata massiliana]